MNTIRENYDVSIVAACLHGGSLHKIIRFHEILRESGFKSIVFLGCDAPLGVQLNMDVSQDQICTLRENGVYILSEEEIRKKVSEISSKLFLFFTYKNDLTSELIKTIKKNGNAKTAQLAIMYDDFIYCDSDYIFLQHPITLWSLFEERNYISNKRLIKSKKIFFAGNIFYEPVCNTWTSSIRTKEDLFIKYSLDRSLPLCIWMPSRGEGYKDYYGKIIEVVKSIPMNILIKLHPWEYKILKHNFDPKYGEGVLSTDIFGVKAIEEKDSSWAMKFCDCVITATSSVGIEIAWWKKPVIYIGKKNFLTEITKNFSVRIDTVDKLDNILRYHFPFSFSDSDYDEIKNKISIGPAVNAFELHVKYIKEILDLPYDQPAIEDSDYIRKLCEIGKPEMYKGIFQGGILLLKRLYRRRIFFNNLMRLFFK